MPADAAHHRRSSALRAPFEMVDVPGARERRSGPKRAGTSRRAKRLASASRPKGLPPSRSTARTLLGYTERSSGGDEPDERGVLLTGEDQRRPEQQLDRAGRYDTTVSSSQGTSGYLAANSCVLSVRRLVLVRRSVRHRATQCAHGADLWRGHATMAWPRWLTDATEHVAACRRTT